MTTIPASDELARELDHRHADGLDVWLIWQRRDDGLTVVVRDQRSGRGFDLDVGDAPPLDVFRHPFTYAAKRGFQLAA
jgi:hypothetical protein